MAAQDGSRARPKRFAHHSESEIMAKRMLIVPENTKKANEKAAKTFRLYLSEMEMPTNFEEFEATRLNEILSTFYFDVRTVTGEQYKASSLENLRASLNRYLRSVPHSRLDIDITKDDRFREANVSYKSAIKELKALGKGSVEHYPRISDTDLKTIYASFDTCTPKGLIDKVQFDIRLYFCRRGMENMHSMTKDTFAIKTRSSYSGSLNTRYVHKIVDELNKNHHDIESSYSAFMPESPGSSLCPVASFEKLLSVSKINYPAYLF